MYAVHPFDERARSYAKQHGVSSIDHPDGRHPTVAELRAALEHLPNTTVEYEPIPTVGQSWGACVEDAAAPEEGPWTQVRTLRYLGEDAPIEIYFEKGWPSLVVQIVSHLSGSCGTLFIVPDTGSRRSLCPAAPTPTNSGGNGNAHARRRTTCRTA
jgi:hypothetical protein